MANHKSSEKRARQTITKTAANKSQTTEVRTAIKNVRTLIAAANKEEAQKAFPATQGLIRKLAKTGIIKKNTAARLQGRLARQIARL